MKKKSNMLKRNSGFLIGCVVAAGVSGFAANVVMTDGLPVLTEAPETEQMETTGQTIQEESAQARVYETDPFTVTASGNIIKGVETESETESETEPQTDENGNVVSETLELDENGNIISSAGDGTSADGGSGDSGSLGDGSGSGSSSGYSDGSGGDSDSDSSSSGYSDGSGSSYDGPAIEIYDSGNGDYYYTDDTGSTGSSGGSGSTGSGSSSDVYTDFWSDSIMPDTYSRYIDESDLYVFNASELRLIRNEIFARHGRIFTSADLNEYFRQKAWYVPTYSPEEFDANMESYLTKYELANLEVILNYEDAISGN